MQAVRIPKLRREQNKEAAEYIASRVDDGTPVFVKSNGRWPGAPRELAWPLAKSGGTA